MGQPIKVIDSVLLGDVALFDTDRSLTGQDGETFTSSAEAAAGGTFPAELAGRLFEGDPSLRRVYVLSNSISLQRDGGWDADSVTAAAEVIRTFFIFYEENRAPGAMAEAEGAEEEQPEEG